MELKLQLKAQEKDVETLEQEKTCRYFILSVVVLLRALFIFRQVKISKMTEEMYRIQNKLITTELDSRKNKDASTLVAAASADSEILNKRSNQKKKAKQKSTQCNFF